MKRSISTLALLLVTSCGAQPTPEPSAPVLSSEEPVAAPPTGSTSAPEASAPEAATAPAPTSEPAPEPGVEVVRIRRSELHGQMTARVGKRVTIKSLLVTSDAPLEPGTPALLMRKVADGEGEDGGFWAPLADVTVQSVDKKANVVLTLVGEREPLPKKPSPWTKGLSVLLRVDRAVTSD